MLSAFAPSEPKDAEELQETLDELEFQLYRMQDNLKEIAKKYEVIGVDQPEENELVIVSAQNDGNECKIMINNCHKAYKGVWDFAIHGVYEDDHTIHIGDIKGPANKGYGSICMNYLKEVALDQNIHTIKGDIAKRDWDHVNRLVHFYEKHDFHVEIDYDNQCGEIEWTP
ncbi:GNAT family protein [Priestia flexa]|uniref:GNAT family N-acetyltransferase n=1 Tax=Priestia flexa TaxID=86664 RepID=UPI00119D557A|nr:GNAT family N-acetyltransferase [Priestia flexa]